jgi:hypothetical protein
MNTNTIMIIKQMANQEIINAKLKTYGELASNEIERGLWNLERLGKSTTSIW